MCPCACVRGERCAFVRDKYATLKSILSIISLTGLHFPVPLLKPMTAISSPLLKLNSAVIEKQMT